MSDPIHILYVDDYPLDRELVLDALEKEHTGFQVTLAASRQDFEAALIRFDFDLVLSDFNILGFEGLQVLEAVHTRDADMPVVIVTGTGSEEVAVEAMKRGAADYVIKTPKHIRRLPHTIQVALENKQLKKQRTLAEAQVLRQIDQLNALQTIDRVIISSLDLRLSLNVVLEQSATQLQADAISVMLFDPSLQVLRFTAGRGFFTGAYERASIAIGQGFSGRAALERRIRYGALMKDSETLLGHTDPLANEGFVAYAVAPLVAKGQLKGVLEVFQRNSFFPSEDWLNLFETLAQQTAIAIDNAQLFENLQYTNQQLTLAYDDTIEGWSRALDLRDQETEGHTQRVTELTLKLAQSMGVRGEALVHMRRGALLHDIGKMGVPDSILLKPGPLTEEEWGIMRKHPELAYEMLSPIAYLRPALDIPYCHHEKWDGTGYPRRLQDERIPLAARIFAVVDVWDALTSDRPYRKAWSREQALAYIRQQTEKDFDRKVVNTFFEILGKVKW